MNKNQILDFVVRQRWRVAQTYMTIIPIVGILNTFLYFLIFLGVSGVDITLVQIFMGFSGLIMIFALVGFGLDKIGYFKKDIRKTFDSATMDAYLIQANWNALNFAYYSKFTKEELQELIDDHRINK